jgi:adenosylmethionine-8-amino-7-oxononanoate aminotransferase
LPDCTLPQVHPLCIIGSMRDDTRQWIEADKRHCWHPFTRQAEWCAAEHEPLVITGGDGVWLHDSEGRRYFDGNSSIWTNLHGHGRREIVEAVGRQMERVSHISFLGQTHPAAIELASRLCGYFPQGTLERVFFSDNGSTAVECALKLSLQYHQQTDDGGRSRFVAFANGYHGDTLGAASLGGVGRFFERFRAAGYPVRFVATVEALAALDAAEISTIAAVVVEPLVQGVNGMRPWPPGMLTRLRHWCDETGVHLILDEVMTGFGRTGTMFACQRESVIPDFLCLAKGLTGGTLPLAATLTTGKVYAAFLGGADRAFYYGHSYTAHPAGCAAALASLDLFAGGALLEHVGTLAEHLAAGLKSLAAHPLVFDVRQCGLVAGIEIRQPDGSPFPSKAHAGEFLCRNARRHGLLTRPILDTLVLMPPLCTTPAELDFALAAIDSALAEGI